MRLENKIRGLLKTFGILFGKRVGGFARRAEEIIRRELAAAPELRGPRRAILKRIQVLDREVRAMWRSGQSFEDRGSHLNP